MTFPKPLDELIKSFARLPGVGAKSAQRFAFSILTMDESEVFALSDAIKSARQDLKTCPVCGAYTESEEKCDMCNDKSRSDSVICVVENARDVFHMLGLQSGFCGKFHVLGGVLSPIDGISPEDLNIATLLERVKSGAVEEIILATAPNVEGEATAGYLAKILTPLGVRVSRIAYGIPMGSNLEYVDATTLSLAIEGRREIKPD